jgi:hypothetical protein
MRRQETALARRDTLPAVMKSKFPAFTIGLDLGDKKHAVCVLNHAGEIVYERSITNHPESLKRLSQRSRLDSFASRQVASETTKSQFLFNYHSTAPVGAHQTFCKK